MLLLLLLLPLLQSLGARFPHDVGYTPDPWAYGPVPGDTDDPDGSIFVLTLIGNYVLGCKNPMQLTAQQIVRGAICAKALCAIPQPHQREQMLQKLLPPPPPAAAARDPRQRSGGAPSPSSAAAGGFCLSAHTI
jgi:hypothetical protein